MAYAHSDGSSGEASATPVIPTAFKILIAGGFGVGKTTLVGSVSEVEPLRTEELITEESVGVDDLSGVEAKTSTTVALDFGRITIDESLILYLFGTPGQDRFWFVWDELSLGALGAVVLVDTRRLQSSFPSVDYFEKRDIPFVVAANCFEGARRYNAADIRVALDLDDDVPVLLCDVRDRKSTKEVLVALVEDVIRRTQR
jgi:signal recognition particle receptor subunit beta